MALGWSIEQVADQLKLAPRQVIALEDGDTAALPNLAVVRGFVRAYAKVVKLDAAPLVAMIAVNQEPAQEAAPARREISASFSESRFPSLTQRSSNKAGWIAGAVLVAALAAAFGAYKMGYIPPSLLAHADKDAVHAPAVGTGAVETTLVKPGQDLSPLPSPTNSVPLISVPPPAGDSAAATSNVAPAIAPAVPATAVPAPAPAATPAAAPVAAPAAGTDAAAAANALVLTTTQDSWIEVRRSAGGAPLMSRLVKAGSTETVNVTEPVLLVVGKPAGVQATLRGAPLTLTPVPGGTTSRLNLK
ncbi:transmembrane protein [Janthinobacterium agaricidamnosum NBRC 102515 = DSM 9628]|uniref:Transmembrane protein n=1 Tax=Janthinobacterium agaricidamnosum NBRC 102515 = DSM 9628 TaxID=1349767 RepID=W0V9Y9_9BURK|nr:transmembrane protein [Janthinobacterium agaricidamnosum NBRC 102515 = DSM 9628]